MSSTARGILLLAVTAAACLAAVPAAHASVKTTIWSSMDLGRATPASPSLFLGAGPNGTVTQQTYRSGDPAQQWSPVYPGWPGSPTTTADDGFLQVLWGCIRNGGCPFSAQLGSVRTWVNRATGRCITVAPSADPARTLRLRPCRWQGAISQQILHWWFPEGTTPNAIPRDSRTLVSGFFADRMRCITARDHVAAAGVAVVAEECDAAQPSYQSVRFLQSGSVTCDVGVTYRICGLPAGWKPGS
jgi:hypothetical protein